MAHLMGRIGFFDSEAFWKGGPHLRCERFRADKDDIAVQTGIHLTAILFAPRP